jgi:hypothetical protein
MDDGEAAARALLHAVLVTSQLESDAPNDFMLVHLLKEQTSIKKGANWGDNELFFFDSVTLFHEKALLRVQ